MKKLELLLFDGVKNCEAIFTHFHTIHERNKRTDGQTPRYGIGRNYA